MGLVADRSKGRTTHGDSMLANLKGIDRLESSPIGAGLFGAAAQCGIPVE
jgi:hypothetical protein